MSLVRTIFGRVARNTIVLLVAFLGSCLSAGLVVATGQMIIASQLDDNPRYQSILDSGGHLALSSAGFGFVVTLASALFVVTLATALPVLIGFLVNRMRSPSNLVLCVVAGGLYGFCYGFLLEGYMHRGDYELLRAAMWGTGGIIGGAVFSLLGRRMERALKMHPP